MSLHGGVVHLLKFSEDQSQSVRSLTQLSDVARDPSFEEPRAQPSQTKISVCREDSV
jgi:hypothetical protein